MTYKIYTLGCKVNEYESEIISELLENHGYIKSEKPDVCIVNTCTVTNKADSKSKKLLRSLRRNNPNSLIIAMGCKVQNDTTDLEYDIAIGNQDKTKILDYIKEYQGKKSYVKNIKNADFENMNLDNFQRTRAYIKIEDGCDNYCSYCIIPFARGHVRCKKHEEVIKEAERLIRHGHKEIVLTGIHTGHYFDNDYSFADLLEDLVGLNGLKRLRISSIEITELDDKFLKVLKNSKILVNHMHIPLQAGSDEILKQMNRKYDTKYFIDKIKKIRAIRPDISITTDVIVGFPGETEEFFQETVQTIKKINFTKIHVFPYSDRKGTKASKMKNHVPENIKKQRVKKLLELSKELELNYMNKFLNESLTFIPEVYKDGYLIGHTENYLLVKAVGTEDLKGKLVEVTLEKINYPYIESKVLTSACR